MCTFVKAFIIRLSRGFVREKYQVGVQESPTAVRGDLCTVPKQTSSLGRLTVMVRQIFQTHRAYSRSISTSEACFEVKIIDDDTTSTSRRM